MDDEDVVCVVALDRVGFIKTCTSCSRADAPKFAKYYRSIGYRSRIMDYDTLEKYQRMMSDYRNHYADCGL